VAFEDAMPQLGAFDTVVMYGNNFGLFGGEAKARRLLRRLRPFAKRIVPSRRDPYATNDAAHLAYRERDRRRGRMLKAPRWSQTRYPRFQSGLLRDIDPVYVNGARRWAAFDGRADWVVPARRCTGNADVVCVLATSGPTVQAAACGTPDDARRGLAVATSIRGERVALGLAPPGTGRVTFGFDDGGAVVFADRGVFAGSLDVPAPHEGPVRPVSYQPGRGQHYVAPMAVVDQTGRRGRSGAFARAPGARGDRLPRRRPRLGHQRIAQAHDRPLRAGRHAPRARGREGAARGARATDDQPQIERTRREPDLGMLAASLLYALQQELFAALGKCGHEQLRPCHGVILAHLDDAGARLTELARLSGQHKQYVGRLVDELEALGYVRRRPDPGDRRSKLIFLTARGRDEQEQADRILAGIEARHADRIGAERYADFRHLLRALVAPDETAGP